MKRKTLAILTAAAMAAGSLSAGVCVYAADDTTHIYVLTAPEDHGWTGSVATFAKEKVEEVNNDGKYTAELITSANAAEQIVNIEDIVASGEDNIAVVIQPIDDTVQSAIQQLVDAEIPYVAFDRIIDGVSSSAVSNVKGDNEGIGAAAAAYFVSEGMTPGEAVYVYEGDTSSVTSLRDSGFTEYLTGELEYDGETIADDKKWTEDDLKSITYSGAMNWSRSDTEESPYPSVHENGSDCILTAVKMEDYLTLYQRTREDRQNPYFAPILEKNLRNLPETLVLTAEYDPLRDEGEAYAKKLEEAGNHVELHRIHGAFHGFFALGIKFLHVQESFEYINGFLNKSYEKIL